MAKTRETDPQAAHRKQDWSWKTGSPDKRERMERYCEWLLTPKADRQPPTKRELAERLGVTTDTLRNYAKEPWLQRELVQRGRALNRVERAQDVLESLYHQAIDPENPRSVQAAKAWLEWVNQRTGEAALDTDIAEMSDDELRELVEHLVGHAST